ncbi:MAG: hypothetical protein RLZZ452_1361, partial [Pseudomonadota bacterium]
NEHEWDTKPLLNTHEVRRIEAKIRAAEVRPIERVSQQIKLTAPKYKWWQKALMIDGDKMVSAFCAGFLVSAALFVPMGPASFIFTGLAVTYVVACLLYQKYHKPPQVNHQHEMAKHKAAQHMLKLAKKYERAGLEVDAKLYLKMANKYLKAK